MNSTENIGLFLYGYLLLKILITLVHITLADFWLLQTYFKKMIWILLLQLVATSHSHSIIALNTEENIDQWELCKNIKQNKKLTFLFSVWVKHFSLWCLVAFYFPWQLWYQDIVDRVFGFLLLIVNNRSYLLSSNPIIIPKYILVICSLLQLFIAIAQY